MDPAEGRKHLGEAQKRRASKKIAAKKAKQGGKKAEGSKEEDLDKLLESLNIKIVCTSSFMTSPIMDSNCLYNKMPILNTSDEIF